MTPFLKDLLGVDVSVRNLGSVCADCCRSLEFNRDLGGESWTGSDLADETVPMLCVLTPAVSVPQVGRGGEGCWEGVKFYGS